MSIQEELLNAAKSLQDKANRGVSLSEEEMTILLLESIAREEGRHEE